MKVICTTSNKYLHLIPVFAYLFNKYWSSEQEVTILGYDKPKCELPENFGFYTLGVQGDVSEWSTDLRRYFEGFPDSHFIWLMEDCFIKRADVATINYTYKRMLEEDRGIGRFDLTNDIQKRPHRRVEPLFISANPNSKYRLSTQASIWNKAFLLKYLIPGLTPWEFETQDPANDGWTISGHIHPTMKVNEGVRKSDPHKLDLNGFPEEDVKHIQSLL